MPSAPRTGLRPTSAILFLRICCIFAVYKTSADMSATFLVIACICILNTLGLVLMTMVERRYQDYGDWANASEGYSGLTHRIYSKITAYYLPICLTSVIELGWFMFSDNSNTDLREAISQISIHSGTVIKYLLYLLLYTGLASQCFVALYAINCEKPNTLRTVMTVVTALGFLCMLIALQWLIIPAALVGITVVSVIWAKATDSPIQQVMTAHIAYKRAKEEQMRQLNLEAYRKAEEEARKNYVPHGLGRYRRENPFESSRYNCLPSHYKATGNDCRWFWLNGECNLFGKNNCKCKYSDTDMRYCPDFKESRSYTKRVNKYYHDN